MPIELTRLSSEAFSKSVEAFVKLSQDVVEADAHLGWERTHSMEMRDYWQRQSATIDESDHVLFVAYDDERLVGTVQYERGHFPTSRHRAEVAKLMIAPSHRRRGVASALMDRLEQHACSQGIELFVLDTRAGEPVEELYLRRGYTRTGLVPGWMKYSNGSYRDTVFFFLKLVSADAP